MRGMNLSLCILRMFEDTFSLGRVPMRNIGKSHFEFADNAGPDKPAHQRRLISGCPLTESVDTIVYVDEQKMPRLYCTYAHGHLKLRCPQNAQGPFSCVVHHMKENISCFIREFVELKSRSCNRKFVKLNSRS